MTTLDQQPTDSKSIAIEDTDRSTEEIFEALDLLVGDINQFLTDFCHRAERLGFEQCELQTNTLQVNSVEQEQGDWENSRVQVEQRLREQVDLLADAWLRLEEEQRRLLQMKEGLALDLSSRGGNGRSGTRMETGQQEFSGGSKCPVQSQQSAVHEFNKLRQEIQIGRPRNNVRKD